ATNCNPGSSYTTSMAYCVATAVLQMGMSVAEAVRAATWGGARALRRETGDGAVGVVRPGARADLHLLDAPSAAWLAYRPGVPLTYAVWREGHDPVPPPSGRPDPRAKSPAARRGRGEPGGSSIVAVVPSQERGQPLGGVLELRVQVHENTHPVRHPRQ